MNNLPFNLTQSPYFLAPFQKISPAYKPPSSFLLRTTLLDETYLLVKEDVEKVIQSSYYLNIITDESENVSKDRIINISINTDRGTFHYCSENAGSMAFTAENLASWLMTRLGALIKGDWGRINSFATDTCSTMLLLWRILAADERLQLSKALFVPCDSHGLQLLIKDVLGIPHYKIIQSQIMLVINTFRRSPLQLSILREKQRVCYGKTSALVLAVITRWGTQARAIESIYKNKDAFKAYVLDDRTQLEHEVTQLLSSRDFWNNIEELRDLILPIHKVQVESESTNAHLGLVVSRWLTIRNHLERIVDIQPSLPAILELFGKRMDRQVLALHWAAYFLTPTNIGVTTTVEQQNMVIEYLRNAHSDSIIQNRVQEQYYMFRAKDGPFGPHNLAWNITSPTTFWHAQHTFCPELSLLATRLFRTPANSVPSERSFSAQNLIHSKVRNSLNSTRVDKLTYIYLNRRVLDHKAGEPRQWQDLSGKAEIELEDVIVGLQDSTETESDEGIVIELLLIDLLCFLTPFTNIIMDYLEGDRDAEETGLDDQEDEPTANYMGSSIVEDNSFHLHDNGQSLDTQGRGSKRPRYTNDDNY